MWNEETSNNLVRTVGIDSQRNAECLLASSRGVTTVPGSLRINGRVDTNIGSTVRTDVVLVRAELATFGSNALQLLLGRSIGIPHLHEHGLLAHSDAMILPNDILTFVTSGEAALSVSGRSIELQLWGGGHRAALPSKADSAAVPHAIPKDLAGDNVVAHEYGFQFLALISIKQMGPDGHAVARLTVSVKRFGRLER